MTGHNIELTKLILSEARFDYQISEMNWARAYKMAKEEPNIILVTLLRTPDREDHFYWIARIAPDEDWIWSHAQHGPVIKELATLPHFTVASVRDDHHYHFLVNDLKFPLNNLIVTANKEQAINLLLKGRADFVLGGEFIIPWRLKEMGLSAGLLKKHIRSMRPQAGAYVAASKPTSNKIIAQLVRSYNTLKQQKKLEKLYTLWSKLPE